VLACAEQKDQQHCGKGTLHSFVGVFANAPIRAQHTTKAVYFSRPLIAFPDESHKRIFLTNEIFPGRGVGEVGENKVNYSF
jgi:hypothetical protein